MNHPRLPNYDLLIRAGRIVCPKSGLDAPGAVAVRGDRIVAIGREVTGHGTVSIDEPEAVLLRRRGSEPLVDTSGNTRVGECWEAVTTIRAGQIVSRPTSFGG